MARLQLLKFEDQPWFPQLLREYMTDYLHFVTSFNAWLFTDFASLLKAALVNQNEHRIVDLCSGGAGPLPKIVGMLERDGFPVSVMMTDSNLKAFAATKKRHKSFDFMTTPVDATNVPAALTGFRTILNAFHHFAPNEARRILEDAAKKRQGIAIMELVGLSPFAFLCVLLTPLFMAFSTPFIKPFRISRLLLTYAVPAIPLFTLWDGSASSTAHLLFGCCRRN